MHVIAYDPFAPDMANMDDVDRCAWPHRLEEADFLVVTSALTESSLHMINEDNLTKVKHGVRVINVGRGPVIHQVALENALKSGRVYSAALDVFEDEPLPMDSYLRLHPRCIFGSHNASNTADAVVRTSKIAIERLKSFLNAD